MASPHANMSDDDNDGDDKTGGETLNHCLVSLDIRNQRVLYHDLDNQTKTRLQEPKSRPWPHLSLCKKAAFNRHHGRCLKRGTLRCKTSSCTSASFAAQKHSVMLRYTQGGSETLSAAQKRTGCSRKLKIPRGTSETLRAAQERSGRLRNTQ